MSIRLMTFAWELMLLASEKLVFLCLCDHADDDGLAWPSMETLAKRCGVSLRTVMRAIAALVFRGLLTVDKEGGRIVRFHVLIKQNNQQPKDLATDGDKLSSDKLSRDTVAGAPDSVSDTHARLSVLHILEPSMNHQQPSTRASSFFQIWWDEYPPHRTMRQGDYAAKCRAEWDVQGLDTNQVQVMLVLRDDCASENWQKSGGQFVPGPLRWLTERRHERKLNSSGDTKLLCVVCGVASSNCVGHQPVCGEHFGVVADRERLGLPRFSSPHSTRNAASGEQCASRH